MPGGHRRAAPGAAVPAERTTCEDAGPMEERRIERLGRDVSVVGLGTWQLGADWGEVAPAAAHAALDAAVEAGVTFLDTADVYGDGRSERFCGELARRHPGVFVATKMGRRAEQLPENYNAEAFEAWNARSRENLGVEPLDLVQLHCPPDASTRTTPSSKRSTRSSRGPDRRLRGLGRDLRAGAPGDRKAPRRIVQIILNCFRLKPLEEVLPAARAAGVGHHRARAARLGAAVGALRRAHDVRAGGSPRYNRHGEAFDVGETFSGVPFETGVRRGARAERVLDPGSHARAIRAALGDRPARRQHGDTRRAQRRAGRQNAAAARCAAARGTARGRPGGVRPPDPRARARALVALSGASSASSSRPWPSRKSTTV